MQKIQIQNVTVTIEDRTIFTIDNLGIEEGEKVGIIGPNGSGKTTFFRLLTGQIETKGIIKTGTIQSVEQFYQIEPDLSYLSGGEKTKRVLYSHLETSAEILALDEPTNHLDMTAKEELISKLKRLSKTVLFVSHDRHLLREVATAILEIENGNLFYYPFSYEEYLVQKDLEKRKKTEEYEQYITEKKRLERSIIASKEGAREVRKAPRRMGNSEARLHRRESTEVVEKLERNRKALETRFSKLEKKDRPKEALIVYMDMSHMESLRIKKALEIKEVSVTYGSKVIVQPFSLTLLFGTKVALLGDNGTGKTSLCRKIIQGDSSIYRHPLLHISYFSQELEDLEPDLTVFSYIRKDSSQSDAVIQNVLARLLFRGNMINNLIQNLSGGEKVKVCLAKMILSEANFLILDEPTNFLDIASLEGLESLLREYKGTVIFTSHDQEFVSTVADTCWILDHKKMTVYPGTYAEYLKSKDQKKQNVNHLLYDMRKAFLSSKIAEAKTEEERLKYEKEYDQFLNTGK